MTVLLYLLLGAVLTLVTRVIFEVWRRGRTLRIDHCVELKVWPSGVIETRQTFCWSHSQCITVNDHLGNELSHLEVRVSREPEVIEG